MKKNKFIINNFKKVGMLIPTVAFATMLSIHPGTFPTKNTPNETVKYEKLISHGYETLNYKQAASEFNERASLEILKEILLNDLNQFGATGYTECEVLEEVYTCINKMNKNTLKLARMYKAMEQNTTKEAMKKTGLELEELHKNSSTMTTQIDMQHYLHCMLDKLSLARSGAKQNEIDEIHKKYKKENFHYTLPDGSEESDMRDETEFALYAFKEDLSCFIFFGHESKNGLDSYSIINKIITKLNEIQLLTSQISCTEGEYKKIVSLINSTAKDLPEELFGTLEMRISLIAEIALQHSFNNLLTNVDYLGYDLKGLIQQDKKQDKYLSEQKNIYAKETF